jgi:CBS domain-containing membrane protein
MHAFRQFALRYLIADAVPLSARERWISALAGCLGIVLMQGVLAVLPVDSRFSYLLAPLGATTVILFALPHSPLAQPWSLVGGLLVSALIGHAVGTWVQPEWLAIGLALGLAIWVTALLRCMHPPGGAMAVVFAIAAQQHSVSLLTAVLNVAAALVAVLAVNNLMPGRRYPQCAPMRQAAAPVPRRSVGHDDLQHALEKLDTYLDVSEDDLVSIYDLATAHAHRRHERRTCGELMSAPAHSIVFATELNEAWALMRTHRAHGLPVIDGSRRVIGILTLTDYLRHVAPDDGRSIGDNIRHLLRPTPTSYTDKPEVAGQIMALRFATVFVDTPLSDVLALLSAQDHPAIVPVVDAERRLVGVLTQTDLLAAQYHRQAAAAARFPATP